MGKKIDTFLNLFGSSDGVHLKICIGYFVTKKIRISFSLFYLENGTYFSICAEKNKTHS